MPERYCFEPCTQEESRTDHLGDQDTTKSYYWVRLIETGEIDLWFERDEWPDFVEFVRPVVNHEATQ